jgi:predicted metal-dependent hydrolase
MGKGLWKLCKKFSKEWYESLTRELQMKGIEITKEGGVNFAREMIIANLWIISHAIPNDRTILDALHKIYLLGYGNLTETEIEKNQLPKFAEEQLHDRYKAYYDAWDEKAGNNQNILAITMLTKMLGRPDKRLFDIRLQLNVMTHIHGMTKAVLDFTTAFEVVN